MVLITQQIRTSALWLIMIMTMGVLEWVGVVPFITRGLSLMLHPALSVSHQTTSMITESWQALTQVTIATRRVQELEHLYSQAQADLSELAVLREENTQLREELSLPPRTQEKVLALPITAAGLPALSVRSSEAVHQGAPVVAQGTLVALVSSVSPQITTIELLSSTRVSPILVQTESGTEGIVSGDGRRVLLKELPRDATVLVGERVMTLGQSGIPKGLLVGLIQSELDQPTAPVKTAVIDQGVSFYEVPVIEVWR